MATINDPTTFNTYATIKFSADINGLAAGATATLGTLPYRFVVDGGWVSAAAGTTNNKLDVGTSTTADAFVANLDNSAGAVKAAFTASTAVGIVGTLDSTSKQPNLSVTVKNDGAANIPSATTLVEVYVIGHFEF